MPSEIRRVETEPAHWALSGECHADRRKSFDRLGLCRFDGAKFPSQRAGIGELAANQAEVRFRPLCDQP